MSETAFCSQTSREFQWLTVSEAAIYLRIKPGRGGHSDCRPAEVDAAFGLSAQRLMSTAMW